MSHDTLTLDVSYDGNTWTFTEGGVDKGSNPSLTIDEKTHLCFVAVAANLTFDATNPVTWDGDTPKGATAELTDSRHLQIKDPDHDGGGRFRSS